MSSMESNTVTITVKPAPSILPTPPSVPISAESDTITITVKPTTAPAPPTPTPAPPSDLKIRTFSLALKELNIPVIKFAVNSWTVPSGFVNYASYTGLDQKTLLASVIYAVQGWNVIVSHFVELTRKPNDYELANCKCVSEYYIKDINTGREERIGSTSSNLIINWWFEYSYGLTLSRPGEYVLYSKAYIVCNNIPTQEPIESQGFRFKVLPKPDVRLSKVTYQSYKIVDGTRMPIALGEKPPVGTDVQLDIIAEFDRDLRQAGATGVESGSILPPPGPGVEWGLIYVKGTLGRIEGNKAIITLGKGYGTARYSYYPYIYVLTDSLPAVMYTLPPHVIELEPVPTAAPPTAPTPPSPPTPTPPTAPPTPTPTPTMKRVKRPLLALIVDFLLEITRGRLPKVHEKLENIKEKYIET